eukprot:360121-Chlamydomonas_euryale.AAC.8
MSALVPSGGVTLEARPLHQLVAMPPQHAHAHQQHQQTHPHHLQHQQSQPQHHSAMRAATLPAPAARSAVACAGPSTASSSGQGTCDGFLPAGAHRRRRTGWRSVLRLIRIGRSCDVGRAAPGSELGAVALTRSDPATPVEAVHSAQQLAVEAHGPAPAVVGAATCDASVMQRNVSLLNDMHLAGIVTPVGSSPGGASPAGSSPMRVSIDLDTWRKAWTADDDSKLVAILPVSVSCSIGNSNQTSGQVRRPAKKGRVARAWKLAVQLVGAMSKRISPQGQPHARCATLAI